MNSSSATQPIGGNNVYGKSIEGIPAGKFFEICDFLKSLTLAKLRDLGVLQQLVNIHESRPTVSVYFQGNRTGVCSDSPDDYATIIKYFEACPGLKETEDMSFRSFVFSGAEVELEFANKEDNENFYHLQISIPLSQKINGIGNNCIFVMIPCRQPSIVETHINGTTFQMIVCSEKEKGTVLVITDELTGDSIERLKHAKIGRTI